MDAWDPTGLPYMFTQATGLEPRYLSSEASMPALEPLCLIPTVPAGCGVG